MGTNWPTSGQAAAEQVAGPDHQHRAATTAATRRDRWLVEHRPAAPAPEPVPPRTVAEVVELVEVGVLGEGQTRRSR